MQVSTLRALKSVERGLVLGVQTRLTGRRRLLLVEGSDARTFLNGLFTQDLLDKERAGTHSCYAGAFLTVKGIQLIALAPVIRLVV